MVDNTFTDVDSSSLASAFDPLPIIAVSIFISPNSIAMSLSIFPISYIILSVRPLELSCSLFLIIPKLTSINSWVIYLTTFKPFIVLEYPFETTIFGQQHSYTISDVF